jgi:hypothetical protein
MKRTILTNTAIAENSQGETFRWTRFSASSFHSFFKLSIAATAFALLFGLNTAQAQKKIVTVSSKNSDISENLDLEAVASIFGESENLADFEEQLNHPKHGISNLDLNEDGYVDYLRVVESTINGIHLISIQAVLGDDLFQDVATIDVQQKGGDNYSIVIVGNDYLFGTNYILEPTYHRRPRIVGFFYSPVYATWYSPYYWGYYPTYYEYRRPYSVYRYHRVIRPRINVHNHYVYHNHYDRPSYHRDHYQKYGRNDYGRRYPDRSFEKRHSGYTNKYEMHERRRSEQPTPSVYRQSEKSVRTNGEADRRRETSRPNTQSERRVQTPGKQQADRPVYKSTEQPGRNEGNRNRNVEQPKERRIENVQPEPSRQRPSSQPDVRNQAPRERQSAPKVNNQPQRNEKSASERKTNVEPKRSRPESNTSSRKSEEKQQKRTESGTDNDSKSSHRR